MAHEKDDHGHGHDAAHGGEPFLVHAHISPWQQYAKILGLLIFLTVLTIGVSLIHLGPLNLAVAIIIATIKASFVVLFFIGTLCFVGVFLAYTINDTGRRSAVDGINGARVDPVSGEIAEGSDTVPRQTAEHEEGEGGEHGAAEAPAGEHGAAAAPAG